jgi:hypothetical protein
VRYLWLRLPRGAFVGPAVRRSLVHAGGSGFYWWRAACVVTSSQVVGGRASGTSLSW